MSQFAVITWPVKSLANGQLANNNFLEIKRDVIRVQFGFISQLMISDVVVLISSLPVPAQVNLSHPGKLESLLSLLAPAYTYVRTEQPCCNHDDNGQPDPTDGFDRHHFVLPRTGHPGRACEAKFTRNPPQAGG